MNISDKLRRAGWLTGLGCMLMVTLVGCKAVGPDFTPPKPPVSEAEVWHADLEKGLVVDPVDSNALSHWWNMLHDPTLSRLIDRAVAGNLDLKQARSRVREARARRSVARGDFVPTFDASGSATWSRTSRNTGGSRSSDVGSLSLDAGWELDLFGGVRRSVEAVDADLQASQEDLRDVLVSLLAEKALDYVDVRSYQARLASAQASLAAQTETYQLTVWRNQAGLEDELAVQQAKYNLESTRSQIPTLRTGLEQAMNAIAVLLGEHPGQVRADLEMPTPIPVPPPRIAVGVPADVVRQRPDIRHAEYNLAAQTARVGVAVSNLYPKLTLNGSFGVEALALHEPSNNDWTASGGPRISWSLFNAVTRPNIEVQSALQQQALITYQSTVLNAIEEVENALVSYVQEQQRRDSLNAAAQAAQAAATQARYKYEGGLVDFSVVLDAERSVLSFQDQLIQSNAAVTADVIRLYKALGGGWTPQALVQASNNVENTHTLN